MSVNRSPVAATDLVNYRSGKEERVYGSLADRGIAIDPEEEYSNSEILYQEVPPEAALAGLIQADIEHLMAERERNMIDLAEGIEPSEKFYDILVDGINNPATRDIRDRLARIHSRYDIPPSRVTEQDFFDSTVEEVLEQVAEHRAEIWLEDWSDLQSAEDTEPEYWLEDREKQVRGRADLLIPRHSNGGKTYEIRELKLRDYEDVPVTGHEYQAAVYGWLAEGLGIDLERVTVEYPQATDRIIEVDFDKWKEEIEQDRDEFVALADSFTSSQEQKMEHLLERETGVERKDSETVEDYRDRAATEERAEEIGRKATRDAINAVKSQQDSLRFVLDMLDEEGTGLATLVNRWEDDHRQGRRDPLWDILRDLYDAEIIERRETGEGLFLEYADGYSGIEWYEALSEVNQLTDDWSDGVTHRDGPRDFGRLDPSLVQEHFHRNGAETVTDENVLRATWETWRGDKSFEVLLEKPEKGETRVVSSTRHRKRAGPDRPPLFSPRHFQSYADRSIWNRINTIELRQEAVEDGVSKIVKSLKGGDILTGWDRHSGELDTRTALLKELNSLSGLEKDLESAGKEDVEEMIEQVSNRYVDPEAGLRPSKALMPMVEQLESTIDEHGRLQEGLMPLGETLGEGETAEEKRQRNAAYIEHGLKELADRTGLL